MNAAALSFLTSLETPSKLSFSAEFSAEGDAGDSAGNGAFDGFANLLDQLVQIAPVDAAIPAMGADAQDVLAGADTESGKGGGKASGKILPVLPVALPGLLPLQISAPAGDASAANAGTVAELPVGRLDMARFAQPERGVLPSQITVPAEGASGPTPGTVAELPVGRLDMARFTQPERGLLPLQLTVPAEGASAPRSGTVAELPVGRLDMARFAQPVAIPQQVSVLSHPSLAKAEPKDAAQPDAVSIQPKPVADAQIARAIGGLVDPKAAAPATATVTPSASPITAQAVASAPVSIAAMPAASIERAPIAAITIAARPTTTVSVSAHLETASAKTLPVAASDTARAILAAKDAAPHDIAPKDIAPKDMRPNPAPAAIRESAAVSQASAQAVAAVLPASAVKGEAKPAPTVQAAAIATVAASSSEGEPETARPVEPVQASARVAAPADAIRPEPAIAAAVGQPIAPMQTEAVTRAADLARPDAFAAIDSIARMVDRLSAARDFGVVPTAALAVMHKEFGELSIAIDRISDTLQVEVAAKDGEAQRALAAALANDRAAAMAGDRIVQRSAEAQQNGGQNTAPNGGQNTGQNNGQTTGQSNGHGANASAADTSGQAASGNAHSQREGQGRERSRADGQPLHARNSAASDRQPTSDDGRYA